MNKCTICSKSDSKHLLKWKKYLIYQCKNCKVIYTTPLPSDNELTEFYQGFMFNKPEPYEIQKQLKIRLNELKSLFNFDQNQENISDKKFLDYGGGTGLAYSTAKKLGLSSYYFDLDEDAKTFTRNSFGLTDEYIITDIESTTESFDYIFSDNVIEHVKYPETFIKNLVNRLKADGTIIIKTPHGGNSEIVFNPLPIYSYVKSALKFNSFKTTIKAILNRYWHCDPPRHIYSFKKKTFEELMLNLNIDKSDFKIKYYKIPLFKNTFTEQFFTKDKHLPLYKSLLIRIILFPIIPIEVFLQFTKEVLLAAKIITPGGIILEINLTK